jgi:hypothetical protein
LFVGSGFCATFIGSVPLSEGRDCAVWSSGFLGLAYYQGKDIIVFRFIIEYCSLRDFGPYLIGSIFIGGFLKDDILACLEI